MTTNLIPLTLTLIILLTVFYVLSNSSLLCALKQGTVHSRYWWLVFGLCLGCLLLIMAVFGIPLPLFLLLLYGLKACELLHFPEPGQRNWSAVNLNFLLIAAIYLITLGVLALCQGGSVPSVLSDPLLRPVSLILLLVLNGGMDLFLSRFSQHMLELKTDFRSEEARLFVQFTALSVTFVLLDSAACLFDLPALLVSLFLIGSNALLLLMVGLFIHQLSIIREEAHLETEYALLESSRSRQIRRTEALRDSAYRDALTGAHSRLYAEDYLARLLGQGSPFALAYIDLDGLKGINDAYGHLAGDRYLQDFVQALAQSLRSEDILARVGGDEFMVLFPDTSAPAAHTILSKARARLAAQSRPDWPLSFSFGVDGALKGADKSIEALIHTADQVMYADKQNRRAKEAT